MQLFKKYLHKATSENARKSAFPANCVVQLMMKSFIGSETETQRQRRLFIQLSTIEVSGSQAHFFTVSTARVTAKVKSL